MIGFIILFAMFGFFIVTLFAMFGFLLKPNNTKPQNNANTGDLLEPNNLDDIHEKDFIKQNPYSIEPIGVSSPVYDIFNNNLGDN